MPSPLAFRREVEDVCSTWDCCRRWTMRHVQPPNLPCHWALGFGTDLCQHLDFSPNKDNKVGTVYFPTRVKFSHLGQRWCFGKVGVSAAAYVLFPRKVKTLGRSIISHLGFTTYKCVGVFISLIFTDKQKCFSSLWVFLVSLHATAISLIQSMMSSQWWSRGRNHSVCSTAIQSLGFNSKGA